MREQESFDAGKGSRPQRVDAVERQIERADWNAPLDRERESREHELLAVCAHELRNPLASLQCNLDALRGCCGSPALDPHLDIMEWQTRKLARIIDDLLDLSRAEPRKVPPHPLRKERVEVAAVVSRAVESTRHVIEARGHALSVALPSGTVHLLADPVRLEQVLVNLLVNAAKYTDPGGRIAVAVERVARAVELRVSDTGIGMSPDAIARVFDLFAQASGDAAREQGGMGVGLALVKTLVEQHGGSVHASSGGRDRGCEFVVRLPLEEQLEARTGRAVTPAPASVGRSLRVLVVDDDRDVADAIARLIDHLGHSVRVAQDGPTALTLADLWFPEIVFLDLGMPFMDGYAVARELLRTRRTPPLLVALTGYGEESAKRRAREAGFVRHMLKPPRMADIVEVLRSVEPPCTLHEGSTQ